MPPEYNPELNSDFLQSLLGPIEERKGQDLGEADRRASAAGLEGQAMIGGERGAIEAVAARDTSGTIAKFNYDLANKNREERLGLQDREYKSAEAQKTRDFEENMRKLGYQHEDAAAATTYDRSQKFNATGFFTGLAGDVLAAGVGGWAGGAGKAVSEGGKSLGKGSGEDIIGSGFPGGNSPETEFWGENY